jgi:NADH:ubiquinone oxidoreductase subunit 6 (subunit J)
MQRFRLMIIMERTISVLISPVLLVALFAVMMFWVHDVDVFEDIMLYMPRLLWGFVVAIVAMLIIYRSFYLQNIKQVMDNLKEIEQFRKE